MRRYARMELTYDEKERLLDLVTYGKESAVTGCERRKLEDLRVKIRDQVEVQDR